MLKIDYCVLLFASLPETILILCTALHIVGSDHILFWREKTNMQKFTLSTIIMLLLSYIIRQFVTDINQSVVLHCIAYITILILIFNIQIYKATFSIFFTAFFYSTVENIYMPYVVTYITKGAGNYFTNDLAIILCSIPLRIAQILFIHYLNKHATIFIAARFNKKVYNFLTIFLIGITITNYSFSQAFVNSFISAPLSIRITCTISLIVVSVACLLVLNLTFEILAFTIPKGTQKEKEFENYTKWLIKEIDKLLENNQIEKAKKLLLTIKQRK